MNHHNLIALTFFLISNSQHGSNRNMCTDLVDKGAEAEPIVGRQALQFHGERFRHVDERLSELLHGPRDVHQEVHVDRVVFRLAESHRERERSVRRHADCDVLRGELDRGVALGALVAWYRIVVVDDRSVGLVYLVGRAAEMDEGMRVVAASLADADGVWLLAPVTASDDATPAGRAELCASAVVCRRIQWGIFASCSGCCGGDCAGDGITYERHNDYANCRKYVDSTWLNIAFNNLKKLQNTQCDRFVRQYFFCQRVPTMEYASHA